ncbi:hypothetical protein PVAP13_5KG459900 [Panicum virgatum]|uniref:Uncharacterized protein n=1 Tax=Panicum virgatum TaxID=38727 RepID=A0A8T0SPL5_PANVG|nr:hypothetical protein PVAP13_5KG459900 [Panicum virgatum]
MVGSAAPKAIARLLAGAAPALRCGSKAPPQPSAAAARSLTTTIRVRDEGRDSEKFWRMIFVVGSVAFACRVVQVFRNKHADIRRANEENKKAWAESREKDERIKELERRFLQSR